MAEHRGLLPAAEMRLGDLVPYLGRVLRLTVGGDTVAFSTTLGEDNRVLGAEQLVWIERDEAFETSVRPLPVVRNRR